MPAAAVIPAPVVYHNVVAVKTLVVGRDCGAAARQCGSAVGVGAARFLASAPAVPLIGCGCKGRLRVRAAGRASELP